MVLLSEPQSLDVAVWRVWRWLHQCEGDSRCSSYIAEIRRRRGLAPLAAEPPTAKFEAFRAAVLGCVDAAPALHPLDQASLVYEVFEPMRMLSRATLATVAVEARPSSGRAASSQDRRDVTATRMLISTPAAQPARPSANTAPIPRPRGYSATPRRDPATAALVAAADRPSTAAASCAGCAGCASSSTFHHEVARWSSESPGASFAARTLDDGGADGGGGGGDCAAAAAAATAPFDGSSELDAAAIDEAACACPAVHPTAALSADLAPPYRGRPTLRPSPAPRTSPLRWRHGQPRPGTARDRSTPSVFSAVAGSSTTAATGPATARRYDEAITQRFSKRALQLAHAATLEAAMRAVVAPPPVAPSLAAVRSRGRALSTKQLAVELATRTYPAGGGGGGVGGGDAAATAIGPTKAPQPSPSPSAAAAASLGCGTAPPIPAVRGHPSPRAPPRAYRPSAAGLRRAAAAVDDTQAWHEMGVACGRPARTDDETHRSADEAMWVAARSPRGVSAPERPHRPAEQAAAARRPLSAFAAPPARRGYDAAAARGGAAAGGARRIDPGAALQHKRDGPPPPPPPPDLLEDFVQHARWQQAGGKLDSVFAFAPSHRRPSAEASAAAGAAAWQRLQGQPPQTMTTRTMTRVLAEELGNF